MFIGILLLARLQVMDLAQTSQALRSVFWSNVPLRHREHFIPDHELLHRRRAQQRRVVVGVEVPLRMRLSIGGC